MIKETKKEKFQKINVILEQVGADENLVQFIKNEIQYLDEKTQKNKERSTEKKRENERLCNCIAQVIENNETQVFSISDIISSVPECNELSVQKVSSLMTMLVNAQRVKRICDKRKRFFQSARA